MTDKQIKLAFLLLIVLQVLAVGLYAKNAYDQHLSRRILHARGQIQIIHFTALSEGRAFTDSETALVHSLWDEAEYSKVTPAPQDRR